MADDKGVVTIIIQEENGHYLTKRIRIREGMTAQDAIEEADPVKKTRLEDIFLLRPISGVNDILDFMESKKLTKFEFVTMDKDTVNRYQIKKL